MNRWVRRRVMKVRSIDAPFYEVWLLVCDICGGNHYSFQHRTATARRKKHDD